MIEFPNIPYNYDKIKLTRIFENEKLNSFPNTGIQTPDSINVYGELKFPEFPKDRTYTLASFVISMDGRVAYLDNPYGPVIAKSNALDRDGADADFWILCLMRANADALFIGAVTMQKEPNDYICVFDKGLEDARVSRGLKKAPWVVICTLDGTDVDFDHQIIKHQDVMFNTSPAGLALISEQLSREYYIVGPYNSLTDSDCEKIKNEFNENKYKKIPVIVTGEGNRTNSSVLLRILKCMGIHTASVESPSYCHSMMGEGLLDELTFNYSCVYIGNSAVGLGKNMEPFTSLNHPHSEVLTLHMHSPSFFYFRHKLVYGAVPNI